MAKTLTAPESDNQFFGHPRGLAPLFFTEMWERYSFYTTRAILLLYMVAPVATGGLAFPTKTGGAIYGFYTAMVYLMCLAGGWVADRITGQRRAVFYGGILIAIGNFCLVAPSLPVFYCGLGLMMLGTGMLKPNVSAMVGQLYQPGDQRRDAGFSIYYMGINLGAFLAPIVGPWISEKINWRYGFAAAGVGMIAGLIQYSLQGKRLGEAGLHPSSSGDPEKDRAQKRNGTIAIAAIFACVLLFIGLSAGGVIAVTAEAISDGLGWFLIAISAVVFAWMILGKGWSLDERKRSVAILVLFVAEAIFWASFEQAGSSLNLFAFKRTNRFILGWEFPAGWFQFIQPAFVIIFAPIFGWLWLRMGKSEPSIPAKFTLGLLFGGLAFVLMVPASYGTNVAIWWLIGCYYLQTMGELCLSPVGLSAMTKLAPARAAGFVMGIWFLGTSIGNWLAGKAGSLFDSMPLPTLFGTVAASALVAAVMLAVLIRPTLKMMSGVK
jgi:POT family proton-dependent oligopeptide transporter